MTNVIFTWGGQQIYANALTRCCDIWTMDINSQEYLTMVNNLTRGLGAVNLLRGEPYKRPKLAVASSHLHFKNFHWNRIRNLQLYGSTLQTNSPQFQSPLALHCHYHLPPSLVSPLSLSLSVFSFCLFKLNSQNHNLVSIFSYAYCVCA